MAVSLPQRVRDLVRLGEDHRQARRPSDAIEVFNEALKLEPENEVALSGLGFTFLDVDDASGALPYIEKALRARARITTAFGRRFIPAWSCIDHGDALFTTVNHLSRALVAEGQAVARGEVVGLSGASGLELVLCFPWVSPHVHFNTWQDGEAVDPFALPGEVSLWRRENDPAPWDGAPVPGDASVPSTRWSAEGVAAGIAACRDPALRARMGAGHTLARRAAELLLVRSYAASAFDAFPPLTEAPHPRRPRLDLPFRREDYRGVAFPPALPCR